MTNLVEIRRRIFVGWRLTPYPTYNTSNIIKLCTFRSPGKALAATGQFHKIEIRRRILVGWRLTHYPTYNTSNIIKLCTFRSPGKALAAPGNSTRLR
ncbi:hypothetical protein CIT292_10684 [Citrobacter youngae ATCC 29220]|uniref:Uncharacterized protein n=1 Tax=Citrobacter youngae ATCC 29220 TaxID=500640 RepID=D4BK68_9ENTR|nr:hypothetical protein CIT292_10684 [Citrobacter youngae ATCC 29220]